MGYLDILEEQVLQAKKIKDLMRLKKQKEEELHKIVMALRKLIQR
jgi:hypothetical protein